MRCLDHVFLRGAMAVALLAFGGSGALLLPQAAPPVCTDDSGAVAITLSMAPADTAVSRVPASGVRGVRPEQIEPTTC